MLVATGPLSVILHALSTIEISPPAYFLALHEWLGRIGSVSGSLARLPSALCRVALVAALWWLATLCCERRHAALSAAALAGRLLAGGDRLVARRCGAPTRAAAGGGGRRVR